MHRPNFSWSPSCQTMDVIAILVASPDPWGQGWPIPRKATSRDAAATWRTPRAEPTDERLPDTHAVSEADDCPWDNPKASDRARRAALARAALGRKRRIDPTTC